MIPDKEIILSPVAVVYWGIPGYVIFWVLFAVAISLFLRRTYRLWRYLLLGRREEEFDNIRKRTLTAISHVIGQWPQFKGLSFKDRSGLGHVLMVWGFFIFVIYYVLFIIIGAGFSISEIMENSNFFLYYSWVMDITAPFIIVVSIWGIIRRYVVRPSRLKGEQTIEALVILITVFIHPTTHLFKQATGIALGLPPAGMGSILPQVSSALSNLFSGSTLSLVHKAHIGFFWAHWSIVLFVLVYIPYTRYLHIVATPFNILFRSSRQKGVLKTINLEAGETLGVSNINGFTWRQLLNLYSCVVCGHCQDACPAYATNKPLNPKKVIQDLKKHLFQVGKELLGRRVETSSNNPGKTMINEVITEEEIRDCTTCGACVENCPVSIDHIGMIVELRRGLVYEGAFDRGHKIALQRVAKDFNPWGIHWNNRAKNMGIEEAKEGERYDCIYWLGCVASYDERAKEIAVATSNILRAGGLKFAMLGVKEKCCGDFPRRIGDEGLFQKLAVENIQVLKRFNFGFILTHCPHCFNSIGNEYPEFGGNFRVVHHTQLIRDLLKERKIHLHETRNTDRVIYHDPCYLGRYNGIYKEPRQILKEVFGEIVEFPRNHNKTFCCGAGGGHMWIEQEVGNKISVERIEEAIKKAAQIVASACPFCLLMFEEAMQIKGEGDTVKVRDVSEIVERFLHRT